MRRNETQTPAVATKRSQLQGLSRAELPYSVPQIREEEAPRGWRTCQLQLPTAVPKLARQPHRKHVFRRGTCTLVRTTGLNCRWAEDQRTSTHIHTQACLVPSLSPLPAQNTANTRSSWGAGMARVLDAAVPGLLVGLAMMTATDAFQPAQHHVVRRPPPSSLSEAPPLGAWRTRPSTGGVVLHARWPFGRRRRDAEKEEDSRKEDTAQQVRLVVAGCLLNGG